MKLNRVLHPEVVLDKKGNEVFRHLFRAVKRGFDLKVDKFSYSDEIANYVELPDGRRDKNIVAHLAIARKFQIERPKVYYVGADFAKVMAGIDREIPIELLPQKFFGYIAFGRGAIFDETNEIEGVYVYIGDKAGACCANLEPEFNRVVWMSYVPQPDATGDYAFFTKFLAPLVRGKVSKLSEGLESMDFFSSPKPVSKDVESKRELVYRAAINTVLYIHSQDPELKALKPESDLSHNARKKLKQAGGDTIDCDFPVTLVSWNYKQPHEFHVDSTWVNTYPRWQRCGVGHSQVKLVWVREHERRYGD